jgi:hypothetical protein
MEIQIGGITHQSKGVAAAKASSEGGGTASGVWQVSQMVLIKEVMGRPAN